MGFNKRDSRLEDIDVDGQVEDEDHNAWAVAYGDVVTVIITFLFLILSVSEINPKKFEQIKNQVENKEEVIQVEVIYNELSKIVEEAGISQLVDIKATSTGVDVNIGEKLIFGSGSAEVKRENYETLLLLINAFRNLPPEYRFSIEGHTDDIPINNEQYPSNWYLSADRALSVLNLFVGEGYAEKRFAVQGLADTKPLVKVFDKNGKIVPGAREKNRRVLIKVQ